MQDLIWIHWKYLASQFPQNLVFQVSFCNCTKGMGLYLIASYLYMHEKNQIKTSFLLWWTKAEFFSMHWGCIPWVLCLEEGPALCLVLQYLQLV